MKAAQVWHLLARRTLIDGDEMPLLSLGDGSVKEVPHRDVQRLQALLGPEAKFGMWVPCED